MKVSIAGIVLLNPKHPINADPTVCHSYPINSFLIHHSTTTAATIIPASLNIATRFPDAAMRVNRVADAPREDVSDVKCSF
jgi:hypothetical protein